MIDNSDIAHLLEPGEEILWHGSPDRTTMLQFAMPKLWVGIPWTLTALIFTVLGIMAEGAHAKINGIVLLFPMFSAPAVLLGLILCAAPYWAARKADTTRYVVTNRRIVIVTGTPPTVKSFTPAEIGDLRCKARGDGVGNLVFAEREYFSQGRTHIANSRFVGIADVRAVDGIIRQAFRIPSEEVSNSAASDGETPAVGSEPRSPAE